MHDSAEAVLITGLGAVAPNGTGVPAFTAALRAGRSGLTPLGDVHPQVRVPAVGAVLDFDAASVLPAAEARRLPRLVPMALQAAREAMTMAALPIPANDEAASLQQSRRIGLFLGTGGGGIDFTIAQFAVVGTHRNPSLWTITNATHGNLAGELSIRLGLRGPSHCISTGCTSSSDAVGTAMLHLQAGLLDAAIVVGADSHLVPEAIWTMQLLGCMTTDDQWPCATQTSRPFDRHRAGFVLAEGAWAIVLERADAAHRRDARPLAHLAGYASTCDAYHRVRPDPDPAEAVRAIHDALAMAGLHPRDVQYVQYHGTATRLNDAVETQTIKAAFADHARTLPGSSIKSLIGHPQGASGAAALVATLAALRSLDDPGAGPFLPPTANLDEPDEQCDLDYVPRTARPTDAKVALVNCLAFGAKNTAILLRMM